MNDQEAPIRSLVAHSAKTGTEEQMKAFLAGLEDLITNSLTQRLTSRNDAFNTITGNLYQTTRLLSKELNGFRTPRQEIFAGLDLQGKVVHDYGSNLGEICRIAARKGAASACGFEFEPYFVLVSRTISTLLGLENVHFKHADISEPMTFAQSCDIGVALSVHTFVKSQLEALARSTRELLIFESHALIPGTLGSVMSDLCAHFPYVAIVDAMDHYVGSKTSRVLCFASSSPLDEAIHARLGSGRNNISLDISLPRSGFVFWPAEITRAGTWEDRVHLLRQLVSGRSHALDPRQLSLAVAEEVDRSGIASSQLYWGVFAVGMQEAKAQVPVWENTYFRVIDQLIEGGKYDQSFRDLKQASPEQYVARFAKRLHLWNIAGDELQPVTLNGLLTPSEDNRCRTGNAIAVGNQTFSTIVFDGFHRLFAALLAGVETYPAQLILYPEANKLTAWELSREELVATSIRYLEQQLLEAQPAA